MGTVSSNTTSLEAQVYEAVLTGNMTELKGLLIKGAPLEHTANGETPLLLACARSDGFDCAKLLVGLGANIHAIGAGSHPVHVAARAGHNRTLDMLIDNGASLLVVDGAGNTPLEVARAERHVSTIRLIENRLCLFSGNMRHQSECVPNWMPGVRGKATCPVWVVLIPSGPDSSGSMHLELLVYSDDLSFTPSTRLPIHPNYSKFHISKPETSSPVFVAEHNVSDRKLSLLGSKIGNKRRGEEVEALMKACTAKTQITPPIPSQPIPTDSPPFHRPLARPEISQGQVPKSRVAPPPHPPFRWPNAHSDPGEDELRAAIKESLKPEYVNAQPALHVSSWNQKRPQPRYHPSHSSSQPQPQSQPQSRPTPQSGTYTRNPPRSQLHPDPSAPSSISPHAYASAGMGGAEMGSGKQREVERDGGGESQAKCSICWENKPDGLCMPCAHLGCCMKCLTAVFDRPERGCPLCRAKILEIIKIYHAN